MACRSPVRGKTHTSGRVEPMVALVYSRNRPSREMLVGILCCWLSKQQACFLFATHGLLEERANRPRACEDDAPAIARTTPASSSSLASDVSLDDLAGLQIHQPEILIDARSHRVLDHHGTCLVGREGQPAVPTRVTDTTEHVPVAVQPCQPERLVGSSEGKRCRFSMPRRTRRPERSLPARQSERPRQ